MQWYHYPRTKTLMPNIPMQAPPLEPSKPRSQILIMIDMNVTKETRDRIIKPGKYHTS